MANKHRGEIEAEIGGTRRRLVLTLGALAELESAFGAEDLVALTERFASGRLAARDLTRIIGAGLRGAGEAVSDEDFKEQLETLNEELESLNAQARELEQTIAMNVAEILGA